MIKKLVIGLIGLFLISGCNGKDSMVNNNFRKAIFLHHSTGANIFGPNGSSVSVPSEVVKYNKVNNLTGNAMVKMNECSWPTAGMGWNNEWYRWTDIIKGIDVIQVWGLKKLLPRPNANKEWNNFLNEYPVVIIKSCFPSSAIEAVNHDDQHVAKKTVEGYKTSWRTIVSEMANKPSNFFVLWTNAPLSRNATTPVQAKYSDMFCRWAKDTLAVGLDQVFGPFPKNVYVFDFFHYLAGDDGILKDEYAKSLSDSHPNSAATEFVAPIFVKEVFDAALQYEKNR